MRQKTAECDALKAQLAAVEAERDQLEKERDGISAALDGAEDYIRQIDPQGGPDT